ncbi:hypothetical protein [Streptomyces sp. NPDC059639]|uniref:hypothetical protein n=1 Tax=Streptomyces sp. NPDC059639 TaxID=3346891 RepID=UPI0036A770F3
MTVRAPFHPGDGRTRYVGPATVVLPDGREAAVTASLVLRYDPARTDNRNSDKDSTWAGSVTLVDEECGVDLGDAFPGLLRMPDGRESAFVATGGPSTSGCSAIGPAPFGVPEPDASEPSQEDLATLLLTHQEVLAKAVRALGGTWDTRRAVTTLHDAGRGDGDRRQQEKRARQALRDVAATGLIVKTDPDSATYRAAE